MAAITRVGVAGPMTAYGTFQAKTESSVTYFDGLTTSRSLMGVGHLWWLVLGILR